MAVVATACQLARTGVGRADDALSKPDADAFDVDDVTQTPGEKAHACFMRRRDAGHPLRHPEQNVAVTTLLVSAAIAAGATAPAYAFRLGLDDRDHPGDCESGGWCDHMNTEHAVHEI